MTSHPKDGAEAARGNAILGAYAVSIFYAALDLVFILLGGFWGFVWTLAIGFLTAAVATSNWNLWVKVSATVVLCAAYCLTPVIVGLSIMGWDSLSVELNFLWIVRQPGQAMFRGAIYIFLTLIVFRLAWRANEAAKA